MKNKKDYVINMVYDGNGPGYFRTVDWFTSDEFKSLLKGVDITYNEYEDNDITFFLTEAIHLVYDANSNIKVAIPSDHRQFHGPIYTFIENNVYAFDYVMTYDKELLEKYPKICKPLPYMTTFIRPSDLQHIYPKSKLCSYITSTKLFTKVQSFRVDLLNWFTQNKDRHSVDLYGRGHNTIPEHNIPEYWDNNTKVVALKDYCFSIAVENKIVDHYFSEKLLDCFLTGTIPIYKGAKKLKEYGFDMRGILQFDTQEELSNILENISYTRYENLLSCVKFNFNHAKNFIDRIAYSLDKPLKHLVT